MHRKLAGVFIVKQLFVLILTLFMIVGLSPNHTVQAQDGQDLPTELYILLNTGEVQQIGLGTAGIQTVTPPDLFILDFTIAPDNVTLTYRTEEGLFLQNMFAENAEPTPLDGIDADIPPLRGRGQTMAWSPLGDALAYTTAFGARIYFDADEAPIYTNIPISPVLDLVWSLDGTYLAAEAENNVWWIYRRNGTQMDLASAIPSSIGFAWADDSRLIFAPLDGGLFLIDLGNANQQSQLADASNLYRLPYVREDGTITVFTKSPDLQDVAEDQYFYQRLELTNNTASVASTGQQLVDISGVNWAPQGDFLIFFQNGGVGIVFPEFGARFEIPVEDSVAFAWGVPRPPSATGFAMTYGGYFLSPDGLGIQQVWQLPRNGLPAIQLTVSDTDVTAYGVNNTGDVIAYTDGDLLLRITVDANGNPSEPQEWAEIDDAIHDFAFSPDDQTLIYASPSEGILSLSIDSIEPAILIPNVDNTIYVNPQFARNVNALMVTKITDNTRELFMYDFGSSDLLFLGTYEIGEWLTDGRVVVYRDITLAIALDSFYEVFVIDPNALESAILTPLRIAGLHVLDSQEMEADVIRVLLGNNNAFVRNPLNLVEVTISEGEPNDIIALPFMIDPRLSPDGGFIAGLTQPNGALIVYNIEQNQAFTLANSGQISQFQWAKFR